MRVMRAALWQCILLCLPTAAVRHSEGRLAEHNFDVKGVKLIAGIPVYNYHIAFKAERTRSFLQLVKNETDDLREHWIIGFKPEVPDQEIGLLCKERPDCALSGHHAGVPFIELRATEADLHKLLVEAKDAVEFVEPDMVTRLVPEVPVVNVNSTGANDTNSQRSIKGTGNSRHWNLDRIGAGGGELKGKGVHIYILDTGIRTTHRAFEGRAIPTLEVLGTRPTVCRQDDTNCAMDYHGHGSHCAGIASGKEYGVAPEATVHAVKVLSTDGTGANSWTLSALDWVATKGQRPAIISMSLGAKKNVAFSFAEQQAVENVVGRGITVVVAAGNEQSNACDFQPAFVPAALAVGAIDSNNNMAPYSNWGSCVGIFAPGSNILSAGQSYDTHTAVLSGTSMACPHVAGAAALLLEANPKLRPAEVRDKLTMIGQKDVIQNDIKGSPNILLQVSAISGGMAGGKSAAARGASLLLGGLLPVFFLPCGFMMASADL